MEGTERGATDASTSGEVAVAATRPAWRVLKARYIGGNPGSILCCSDSTRMEGTERTEEWYAFLVELGCSDSTRMEGTERSLPRRRSFAGWCCSDSTRMEGTERRLDPHGGY